MGNQSSSSAGGNNRKSVWEITTSVSTAVMTAVTFALAFFTYKTVEFNRLLLAEPQARIEQPVTVKDEAGVSRVAGNDAFCGPSGFNLHGFSPQRVLVFEVSNTSELVAPKIFLELRAVQAPATALTGILAERILEGVVIETLRCTDLGLDPARLAKDKLPQAYEVTAGPLQRGGKLRVSVAYAHRANRSPASSLPGLLVTASPVGSRFAVSAAHRILPLSP